mmetsp:Transcript_29381/g.68813  ORF Transcript_29381/g.68813 Transcript_29381/m.68813 type:complete len:200 (-) Transcript_29381:1083-1682(-)
MEVNAPCLGSLNNELGLMDALSTRQDLLTTDEEIIAVGELGILRIGHGVERTNGKGVLVHHEKVRAVLLLDNLAKFLLILGAQILIIVLVDSCLSEELASLGVRELQGRPQVLEILKRVLLPNPLQLVLTAFIDAVKDMDEEVAEHVQDLVVVLIDAHLHVEASEFAQMPPSVGVLCSKYRPSLKDSLEARAGCRHLLM